MEEFIGGGIQHRGVGMVSGAHRAVPGPQAVPAIPAVENVVGAIALETVEVRRYRLGAGSLRAGAWPGEPIVSVVFVERGGFHVGVGGRRWTVSAGQAMFLHSTTDYVFSRPVETESVMVSLFERVVRSYGARVEDMDGPLFPADSALLAPASAYFGSLVSNGRTPDRVATYAMSRLAEEMVGSLFLERSSIAAAQRPARVQSPLYHQALALIASRRADPTLTITRMASELAVSVRHLQRAFQERGSSPTEEIRRLRVELAQSLLTEARYDVLSIEAIAQHSGFGSADDLRRAFRLQQVAAPSQLRAQSRQARRERGREPVQIGSRTPPAADQRRRA